MAEDKAKTKVPLNSPMHKNRNPSWQKQQLRESKYKTPEYAWMAGNGPFRRYANGMLDIPHAVTHVLECLDKAKDGGYLNEMEKCILSIIVPGMDALVSKEIASTKVRLSPEEEAKIRLMVVANRREALNWNAGRGGGSVPMRTSTKS